MAELPKAPELVTITTPGGARFTVAKAYAPQFQGLANQLEAGGYAIDPTQSGGYNPRYIAGTTTPSEHASGRAIDVNWNANRQGTTGAIPADVARAVAQQYGMTWGGDWQGKTRDPMHFEVASPSSGTGNFGVANANLPTPPVPPEGATPSPVAVAASTPDVQPATSTVNPALVALALGNTGVAGGPGSLGQAFAQAAQAGQQQDQQTQPVSGLRSLLSGFS